MLRRLRIRFVSLGIVPSFNTNYIKIELLFIVSNDDKDRYIIFVLVGTSRASQTEAA